MISKKIEKLTDNQISKLSLYRDKWLEIGLRTSDSIDREATERALREVYRCANMPEPATFIYLQNPLEGCMGAYLLSQVKVQVRDQVRDQVWDQVREQVWAQVKVQVREQVWVQVGDQVRDQVWDQVRDQVWDQVREQRWKCGYGLHDANWLAFYDFMYQELKLKCCEKLKGLISLSKLVGWWWPFEKTVIITPPPIKIMRDDEHRLHCEDGPALQYPGDFKIHTWHGVSIPSEWVEKPNELNPAEALEWPNQEQRRALCEIIGWDRVLETLECRKIHSDERGELIETNQIDDGDEIARFVKVIDPSTNRRHALRVPPSIETATGAVAWTFGIEEADYNPTQEA